MVAASKPWVAARRAHSSPFADDPRAVCRRTTGGPDGLQPSLAAVYGHDGMGGGEPCPYPTTPPLPAEGGISSPEILSDDEMLLASTAAGAPPPATAAAAAAVAWPHRRHDAALLHAVATAPGDLQHMAAIAAARAARADRAHARAAAAAAEDAEEAEAAGRWPDDASSSRSTITSNDSVPSGMSYWMGWLPRVRRAPLRPAAPPKPAPAVSAPVKAAPAPAPAFASAVLSAPGVTSPPCPSTPPLRAAAAAAGTPRRLPPSEALPEMMGARQAGVASVSASEGGEEGEAMQRVLSDPGLYRPEKTCEEGTQTWGVVWKGPGGERRGDGGRVGFAEGMVRSVMVGALAGMGVLLIARVADGGGHSRGRKEGRERRRGKGELESSEDVSSWMEERERVGRDRRVGHKWSVDEQAAAC